MAQQRCIPQGLRLLASGGNSVLQSLISGYGIRRVCVSANAADPFRCPLMHLQKIVEDIEVFAKGKSSCIASLAGVQCACA